ncbi:MAG: 6,7-dimethyl-8-ribityllumazine synthase [Gammaproteobacteria bacterium]|nr:6,7-dimethyl-8-ribityllumazine synthase [Gammaproteobacteria bacterium]
MSNDLLYSSGKTSALRAENFRFAIVAARFNAHIVDKLLAGAEKALLTHGADSKALTVVRVPGAFELPLAAQKLAATGRYDAVITLGCVIRGDTPHFDYVCNECARGINEVALKYNMPVIFGVLTTDNTMQAEVRAADNNNKGIDAALTAIEILQLYQTEAFKPA